MKWKLEKHKENSQIYNCYYINPHHNHPQLSKSETENYLSFSLSPNMKDEIRRFYRAGFTATQIHRSLNATYPNTDISILKIKNFTDYELKNYKKLVNFDFLVQNNDWGDRILITDKINERIFVSTNTKKAQWINIKIYW
ncbi:unnamed protein product [Blepharisma stoltei]|uniref:Uncharacterized protein n=1 Tax=Blepharisma stoltei TaxID=1481888 RepID=A0AAU9JYK3_9CILI|nr:unnamed protein product [Blepharisma stoltei]